MLFVALTGRYPYDGSTAAEVLSKQLRVQLGQGQAPRPRDVDPSVPIGLDSLCAEATHVDRARRTSSATIFLLALQKARARGASRRLGAAPADDAAPAVDGADVPVAPSLTTVSTVPDVAPQPGSDAPNSLVSRLQLRVKKAMPILIRARPSDGAPGDVDWRDLLRRALPGLVALALAITLSVLARSEMVRERAGERLPPPLLAPPPRPVEPVAPAEDDPKAMFALAQQLEPRRVAEAVRLYRRAAEAGLVEAMVSLALLYEEGRPGLPSNEHEARRWLEEAAALGHVGAERRLEAMRQAEARPAEGRSRGRR